MLLKYCRPVGYPGDLQVHPRVDPYPYFATYYGYVLNPQLSKPAGNNPGIDWVNPRQTLQREGVSSAGSLSIRVHL